MEIATQQTTANKTRYARLVHAYAGSDQQTLEQELKQFISNDASISVVHPINELTGAGDFVDRVVRPMSEAFSHLYRRSNVLIGGEYKGGEWVATQGHYIGRFDNDWMGIPASGEITTLRYIEFHRIEDSRSVESFLFIDLLDLLRQIGRWPLPNDLGLGQEMFSPGPGSGDGIRLEAADATLSASTLKVVEDMLAALYSDDESWRPYWDPNVLWYGPSGYGTLIGIDGFARFQTPYEAIFDPERTQTRLIDSGDATLRATIKGQFARFADGEYAALGGWPAHGSFLVKDWLGVKANDKMFTVRVADMYRLRDNKIAENWVYIDLIAMLNELGFDAFAAASIELTV